MTVFVINAPIVQACRRVSSILRTLETLNLSGAQILFSGNFASSVGVRFPQVISHLLTPLQVVSDNLVVSFIT